MGGYTSSLCITLEDALEKDVPPAVHLYLAYLHCALAADRPEWADSIYGFEEVRRFADFADVWRRDAARHSGTPYGQHLNAHIQAIYQIVD